MKIYRYANGEIHEAEVRETKQKYIAFEKTGAGFDYKSRFAKEDCCLSAMDAFDKFIDNHIKEIPTLKQKIHDLNLELGQALQDKAAYLVDSMSRCLYEILIKHLEQAAVWKCGSDMLAERLVIERSFPLQMFTKLEPAINKINANTPLKVEMTTEKNDDGRTIFVFTRISTSPIGTTD